MIIMHLFELLYTSTLFHSHRVKLDGAEHYKNIINFRERVENSLTFVRV